MPITQERQKFQDMRAVGFSEDQAALLAAKFEATAQAASEDIKAFISSELDRRFAEMEARFERSLRLQLAVILSAFVGVTGLAVAVIKLVP
ncbi:MAG: hypothetical protein HY423_05160 [Candidatus Lambdaproteobacteria bacterium]|nr:hypothetical protein [Candidatus Lambdaproteobacteria bacterium]